MSHGWESQATGGEAARAELRGYLEALIKQFDREDGQGPDPGRSEAPLEEGEAPRDRTLPSEPRSSREGTPPGWPPPPASDEYVTLQVEIRDELRALRQDLRSQHREVLQSLEQLRAVTDSRIEPPGPSQYEIQAQPEHSASGSVDEYQRELLDDLHRATRRLLNWYLALAGELSATRSVR
jgi:hypothetical protein